MTRQLLYNGKPVHEADKPLVLRISSADISSGVPHDEQRCAIAKSACRQKGVVGASIMRTVAYIEYGRMAVKYSVDGAATNLLALFDVAGTARPVAVTLSPVRPGNSRAAKAVQNAKQLGRPTGGPRSGRKGIPIRADALTLAGVRRGNNSMLSAIRTEPFDTRLPHKEDWQTGQTQA